MSVDAGRVPIAAGFGIRSILSGARGTAAISGRTRLEALWRAALIFLPLAALTTIVFALIYRTEIDAARGVLKVNEEKTVELERAAATASLSDLAAGISVLAADPFLQDWLATDNPALRTGLEQEYLAFIEHRPEFDQVRFIGLDGREMVRADHAGGSPHVAPVADLQDKSNRPYVKSGLSLGRDEIYISPFDLNVENGEIELPIKPTIRIAEPVFDRSGAKRGIVVLNYLGKYILDQIASRGGDGKDETWLVNADGYWLHGPTPEDDWAFMYPERQGRTFAHAFPAAWQKISGATQFGQFSSGGDLFTYTPLSTPTKADPTAVVTAPPVWYLVAHVDAGSIAEQLRRAHLLGGAWIATFLVFLFLLAATALAVGRQTARKHHAERQNILLNERLVHDNETLQALNHELESFSYSVSHDLRSPLRAIDGFSKALLDDCADTLSAEGRDHLSRVRNAAQRMGELIDDLLNLSRVGRTTLALVDGVNLSEMATSIADDLKRLEPTREVEFVIAPDIRARCDRRLVRIAMENLFSNAWKFTSGRNPAIVEFGCTSADGQTAYFVRDNGVGFDMAHAGKLFGAFQRLHANHEFPGTGIGLATVERVMKKHGGRAWAEAVPDRGATLFFTL
jgi:signal transduction histidine kinase